MATIKARRQAHGTIRYTAIVRLRRGRTILHREAKTFTHWCYRTDFSGLVFWARKGADASEPMQRFDVSASELDFWQALARGVAYAA